VYDDLTLYILISGSIGSSHISCVYCLRTFPAVLGTVTEELHLMDPGDISEFQKLRIAVIVPGNHGSLELERFPVAGCCRNVMSP